MSGGNLYALTARAALAATAACALLACQSATHKSSSQGATGSSGSSGAASVATGGASSAGASAGDYAGSASTNPTGDPVVPFEAVSAASAVRKVKNLLVGLPPTDDEVQSVAAATDSAGQVAALKALISGWMTNDEAQFRDKLLGFFRNSFQQTGFVPTQDFKPQLLENGGFDLGPLGVYADDAFPRLVQNLQDSFALTAWDMVKSGAPFTGVLTTTTFEMTTALKSLYLQIEMPNDQPYSNGTKLSWKVDMSGSAIPLTDTLNPASSNYMVFDDQAPVTAIGFQLSPTCQGTAGLVNSFGGAGSFQNGQLSGGYSQLFQRLFGFTARHWFVAQPDCWEHASKPYFSTSDLTDWTPVNVVPKATGAAYVQPYDLPTLRTATQLSLALPRVGFFTTPAYLALWNTNDSNQHRVTANQTLLVAWGESFTSDSSIVPVSTAGLAADHAVVGSDCYGCHKSLDPLRQFWGNQFDYNDRNDFAASTFGPTTQSTRPTTTGGTLAFGSVNASGTSLADLGNLLAGAVDSNGSPVQRFAISFAQKLCYFADSASCAEDDPEFRRVAKAFQDSQFDFKTLVSELFSSPLVTALAATQTFQERNVVVSITRRDELCTALSNRLELPDLCALAVAFPFSSGFGGTTTTGIDAQRAALRIAGSLPADGFGRGSEVPIAPATPTLFFRAASEMLCENVAGVVVDATNSRYQSSDYQTAITDMVARIMGYPPADVHHDKALQILTAHYQDLLTSSNATTALRSTFALACQSPSSLGMGI